MDILDRVKQECYKKNVPISQLENDCGFSNGYIRNLKRGTMPMPKLEKVAKRLNVSVDYLMTGENDLPQDILDQNEAEMERLHRAAFRPEMELLIDTVKDAPDDVLIRLRYYAEGLMAGRREQ